MKRLRYIVALTLTLTLSAMAAKAQSYYDDDIYYDAERAKKEKAEALRKRVQANYVPNTSVDFPGADTYTYDSGSTRDIDEYNRHNLPYAADTLKYNANGTETFTYTRNIERFHNPEVVSGSADDELQYLYYTDQQPTSVNIYIDGMYYNPYSYRYWSPVYSPWYDPWNSWTWGYGPYWGSSYYDWYWGYPSWGWSWGWGYPGWGYPGWAPGWTPAPGGSHGWAHNAPSGASRPHYDRYNNGPSYGYRDGAGRRPTGHQSATPSYNGGSGFRPDGSFTPSYETRTGRRPGAAGYGTAGSTSGGNRYGTGSNGSSGRRNSGYGNSNSNSYNNSNSYRNNSGSNSNRSSNSGYRSGSGYNGGSRSTGGGSRSGGGGGGSRGRH